MALALLDPIASKRSGAKTKEEASGKSDGMVAGGRSSAGIVIIEGT
jgi:hypothetical protein